MTNSKLERIESHTLTHVRGGTGRQNPIKRQVAGEVWQSKWGSIFRDTTPPGD
jgi:hypothetical protein